MTIDAPKVIHVRRRRVEWLWRGRIPRGKLVVLDGDPGLGKSTVALDLAARLSTASPLPDGATVEHPLNTIVLSAEDDIGDTIRPRLEAAGADLNRVTVFRAINEEDGSRPPVLPADLDHLEGLIIEDQAALVVIDPLTAFLASVVDTHRDQDVRHALHALAELAGRTGVAAVVVRHLNKLAGGSALYRGGGSIGIIGAARAGMVVASDPGDDKRNVLAVTKSNLAIKPPSLAYRLVPDEEHDCPRVRWDGRSELTADALLNPPRESRRDAAAAFLRDILADGPVLANEVYAEAEEEGISTNTLKRAKKLLEVVSYREGKEGEVGGGAWWWALNGKEPTDLEDQPLPNQMVPLISPGEQGERD